MTVRLIGLSILSLDVCVGVCGFVCVRVCVHGCLVFVSMLAIDGLVTRQGCTLPFA